MSHLSIYGIVLASLLSAQAVFAAETPLHSATGVLPVTGEQKAAPNALAVEMLGFGHYALSFGWAMSGRVKIDGQDRPVAELYIFSAETQSLTVHERLVGTPGEEPAAVLANLREQQSKVLQWYEGVAMESHTLGADLGTEMYKSGSATKAPFTIEGVGAHIVTLKAESTPVTLGIDVDGEKTSVKLADCFQGGTAYSINSLRLAASGKMLAILVKYTAPSPEGERRVFGVHLQPVLAKGAGLAIDKVRFYEGDFESNLFTGAISDLQQKKSNPVDLRIGVVFRGRPFTKIKGRLLLKMGPGDDHNKMTSEEAKRDSNTRLNASGFLEIPIPVHLRDPGCGGVKASVIMVFPDGTTLSGEGEGDANCGV